VPAIARPPSDLRPSGGLLLLDELVAATYPLEDAASAFVDLAAGRNAKTVLLMA
jgi:Zn-dependent alcohol dehydrogenase